MLLSIAGMILAFLILAACLFPYHALYIVADVLSRLVIVKTETQTAQSASTVPQFLFQEDFAHYEFKEKKEINGETFSLFLYVSGLSDKVSFVQVYKGDLENAFKNNEKIPYYKPVLYEYINDAPDENLHSTRYETNIYFSADGKNVIVEFNNGDMQIIAMELL